MTDNEIIEAFENNCNSCENCPYHIYSDCDDRNRKDILDLIKRQQAEINHWKETANSFQNMWGEAITDISTAKAEAIKEFGEKLKKHCMGLSGIEWNKKATPLSWAYAYENFCDDIDNIVKEMTGDEGK